MRAPSRGDRLSIGLAHAKMRGSELSPTKAGRQACHSAAAAMATWHEAAPDARDDEELPLLGQKRPAPSRRELLHGRKGFLGRHSRFIGGVYFGMFAVNGAIVAALGPSVEALERATGLGDRAIGNCVLQNRLAKLAGATLFGWYAQRASRSRGREAYTERLDGTLERAPAASWRPHAILAAMMVLSAACSGALAFAALGALGLQLTFVLSGLSYGVSDTGASMLTLWRWAPDVRMQRVDIAMLNAGFTIGASVSPALVALSLRLGDHRRTFQLLGLAACVEAALLPCAAAPPPQEDAADAKELGDGDGDGDGDGSPSRPAPPPAVEPWREKLVIGSLCVVAFGATGCEHALATWLAPFGAAKAGLGEERMALMSSSFWATMCAGRLLWAVLSGVVRSGRGMLLFSVCVGLVGAVCVLWCSVTPSEGLMWAGALGLGLGVSSAFPCAITLPPEAGVPMTPIKFTLFQIAGTTGEVGLPYIVGLAFERRWYASLGLFCVAMQLASLVAMGGAIYGISRPRQRGRD